MRRNNIPLPNLSVRSKLFYSALLIAGLIAFGATWLFAISVVYMGDESSSTLGVLIGSLAWDDFGSYVTVFALHVLGMLLLLGTARALFGKTSLRRRVKKVLFGTAVLLALLDISAWSYAPSCSSTNLYVGVIGIVAAIPLIVLTTIPLLQMWVFRRWKSSTGKVQRVVIVGGGFGGLYAALGLHRALGYSLDLEITVIDKNNYFLFPPLLPSAAVGSIEARQVTYPFRRIFETTNIIFRKVEVTGIDPKTRTVRGKVEVNEDPASGTPMIRETEFCYDYLVLAPGSTTQTFNTPGAEDHAFFMRELGDAAALRNQVIDCFERAACLSDTAQQSELLRFVIVGGGPTGIETATEIHDLIHAVLLKRYPEIDPTVPQVSIVQSAPQLLPGWHDDIVRTASQQLERMKLKIYLNARVTNVGANSVTLKDGTVLPSRTIVWCAGVKPSPLLTRSGIALHPSGRVSVGEDLRIAANSSGSENVFVLGDAAYLVDARSGKPLPPLGQVAFQQGSATAKNIVRLLAGEDTKPFKYFDFGGLVSVGEHFAAVNLMGVRISGFLGWFIWRSLYLSKIVGMSNRIRIVIDWTLDLLIERSITQFQTEHVSSEKKLTSLQPISMRAAHNAPHCSG